MTLGTSAIDDEFTALAHAGSVRRARTWGVLVAGIVVTLAASFVAMFMGGADVGVLAVQVFFLLVLLWWTAFGWWCATPASRRLLAEHPWQAATVRVLNTRGTVLALPDGQYFRVNGLPSVAREVVVRAGRVWLAGPDSAGKAAVRVDGLLTAWKATRIEPRDGTAALPSGGEIATMTAHSATAATRRAAIVASVFWSLVLVLLVLEWHWWTAAATIVGLACAATSWLVYARLRRLRPTGPWLRAEASAPTWRLHGNGFADGTVDLDLPDGRAVVAHLDRAQLDLFANVRQEGALWVAGDVVGFPHYPVLAAARFTPR